ncbi:hypothetical protein RRG08_051580 [Elysia crispata]|uniref:Uncharacterized protein n=1 Tax=Elysia crispata TaxID=231223 RepID=A0AAE1DR68_9GAST|nr:hypothetical protein RRG08_051580 [Elysia crispata]
MPTKRISKHVSRANSDNPWLQSSQRLMLKKRDESTYRIDEVKATSTLQDCWTLREQQFTIWPRERPENKISRQPEATSR